MFDQLQLLTRQLSISQRIGILGGAAISAIVLVLFVMWAGKPDMQPAFTALSTQDAATISQALRTAKIPFQVTDAGATILVPASELADARVAAGATGTGAGGSTDGFGLFDKNTFGMSDFQQQVTYQRAIEAQLTQTIESITGVASVQVSVVAAQDSVFTAQAQPATASVVIKMRDGGSPDRAMVQGIVSTVAGAVRGLTADNVTVVDGAGHTLAGPDGTVGGDAQSAKGDVERGLEAKIQAMVDQALGAGHSTVAVAATVNMDKVEQTVTTVNPITNQNWTPTSVQVTNENYGGGTGTNGGGIPGSLSNVPGLVTYPGNQVPTASAAPAASASPAPAASPGASPGASSSASGAGYNKTQTTVNYDNSQTIEKIIKQPGAIEKLSVSVLLDQAALGSVTADGLKTAIAAAIGADTTRGDVVEVTAVPFAAASPGANAAGAGASPLGSGGIVSTATSIGSSVLGVLVALFLLFLVWRNLRALRRRADDMQLIAHPNTGQGVLEAYTSTGEQIRVSPIPAADDRPQAKIQEHIRAVADDKPEELVGLMSTWLRADQKR